MFKKIALALTFLTAFSVAGLSFTNTADAWRLRAYSAGRPYTSYYYGPPRAYYYGYRGPYRSYYYGPRVVRPYTAFYGPSYYYGGPIYR
jgi:hypothetical protein